MKAHSKDTNFYNRKIKHSTNRKLKAEHYTLQDMLFWCIILNLKNTWGNIQVNACDCFIIFIFCCCCFAPHLAMLKDSSWLFAQYRSLVMLRGPKVVAGIQISLATARHAAYLITVLPLLPIFDVLS